MPTLSTLRRTATTGGASFNGRINGDPTSRRNVNCSIIPLSREQPNEPTALSNFRAAAIYLRGCVKTAREMRKPPGSPPSERQCLPADVKG